MATTITLPRRLKYDTGELSTNDTTQALRLSLAIVLVAGLLGAAAAALSGPGESMPPAVADLAQAGD
jgi:hypothetical protein